MRALALSTVILLAGCNSTITGAFDQTVNTFQAYRGYLIPENNNPAYKASYYLGYNETSHRQELKDFTGVDPVRTEWCAAFVNSVLEESGIPSNKDHTYSLTARAYLDWGISVAPEEIEAGDVVVFPRGNQGWQGHVGFYIRSRVINGTEYYAILGGNQSNSVSIELFPASSALGIRRSSI